MNLTRRALLKGSALVPLAVACSRPRPPKEVLLGLALDVATEDTRSIVETSVRLAESLRGTVEELKPAALDAVRGAWKTALLAWRRASCFQTVPLVKSNALLRATFFPVRVPAVEQIALSGVENDASVAELGIDRKGMFALEVLLFGAPGASEPPLCERAGVDGLHARRFAHLLGSNVAGYARSAASALGDGKAFAESYAAGGHETLSRLVGEMVGTIGSMTSGRLSKALSPSGNGKPGQIQGYSSGTALDILATLAEGVQRLYEGGPRGGLAELVHAKSAATDARLRERFDVVRKALDRARRTRSSAPDHELASALEAVRALDRALETELMSALGVTLVFAGADAD